MPPASSKSPMSLGELAVCEDFLDGNREYANDLLSNIEKVSQWHGTDVCPEALQGRTCVLCELCSTDGLMGVTKQALASYDDAEKHIKSVRASFGKSVPRRGALGRETLFTSNVAKSVFFSIVTVGDTLRSHHATWQARLKSEVATSSSSAQGLPHTNTGPEQVLLPTYSSPKVVSPESNPKATAVSIPSVPGTTSSSSMFVVFRRCLSSDCPCEANRARATSNTSSRVACGSQVSSNAPPSSSDSKKKRTSKATAKSEAAIRGDGNRPTTTTNLEHRSRKTSDSLDVPVKAKTSVQAQHPSTYHDLNSPNTRALDAPRAEGVMLEKHTPSTTALCTQQTESSSSSECGALILDPRVFRLATQIARSDDARRALMEWCRACRADLQPRENGTEAPLTREPSVKGRRGYPFRDLETVEPGKSPCMRDLNQEATTIATNLSHDDVEMMAQELRFNSEQEELKGRWLMARQKRCIDRKRRPSGLDRTKGYFEM